MIIPHKERFRKVIIPPPDKALTQRAIILSLVTKQLRIYNPSLCGDCISALDCITALGAKVKITNDYIQINFEKINTNSQPIKLYAGNSATTARLLLGLCVGLGINIEISGDSSLKKRSMKSTIKALKSMGAKLTHTRQKCPIINTKSSIKGIKFKPDYPSAQIKSAVLLAGLNARTPTKIYEQIATRDHTERMLSYFGFDIEKTDECITINPSSFNFNLDPTITIGGDISSVSFLIAVALITKNGYAFIKDVIINPTRMGMIYKLIEANANITIEPLGEFCNEPLGNIIVNNSTLNAFDLDAKLEQSLIDEIPILAVIACFCNGVSTFKNLNMIKNKESNRMREIFKYLKRFGANIELIEDTLIITGNNLVKKAVDLIEANKVKRGRKKKPRKLSIKAKDHRIIMALAVAGVLTDGCVIEYPHLANISYPNFFNALLD